MKAVRKQTEGPGNIALCDIPEPSIDHEDQVKIAVRSSGICGTDLHIRDGDYGINPPVTLGHEICGDVIEVGGAVTRIRRGDRVTVNPTANGACGKCRFCRVGAFYFCPSRASVGSGRDGGFADYLVVPSDIVFPLPDTVTYDTGALVEPFACCVNAVCQKSDISPGSVVLVCGPGPIGLMCAALAVRSGAQVVVAGTDADSDRLETASELGVLATVDVSQTDVVDLTRVLSDGYGADVVIDCGGTQGSVSQCLLAAANMGQYTQVALIDHPFEIDWGRIIYKQLRVQGTIGSDRPSWDRAYHLVRTGQIDLGQFISHRHGLEDWEIAFANADEKRGLKQLLCP